MDKDQEVKFNMTASEAIRNGAYANLASVRTTKKESVIDFFFADSEKTDDDGSLSVGGVMCARVVMSNDTLVELRDMLNGHIANGFREEE